MCYCRDEPSTRATRRADGAYKQFVCRPGLTYLKTRPKLMGGKKQLYIYIYIIPKMDRNTEAARGTYMSDLVFGILNGVGEND